MWTAGGSNLPEADGSWHYKAFGPQGESFFNAHSPCIDAVKSTGADYIIWCPGLMKARGVKSSPPPPTLLQADPRGLASWDFVSYGAVAPPGQLLRAATLFPAMQERQAMSRCRTRRGRGRGAGDGLCTRDAHL